MSKNTVVIGACLICGFRHRLEAGRRGGVHRTYHQQLRVELLFIDFHTTSSTEAYNGASNVICQICWEQYLKELLSLTSFVSKTAPIFMFKLQVCECSSEL